MVGMPEKVKEALLHVHAQYPEVTQVFYGTDKRWLYCGQAFEWPDFDEKFIDVALLEEAVNAVERFPAAFALSAGGENVDEE